MAQLLLQEADEVTERHLPGCAALLRKHQLRLVACTLPICVSSLYAARPRGNDCLVVSAKLGQLAFAHAPSAVKSATQVVQQFLTTDTPSVQTPDVVRPWHSLGILITSATCLARWPLHHRTCTDPSRAAPRISLRMRPSLPLKATQGPFRSCKAWRSGSAGMPTTSMEFCSVHGGSRSSRQAQSWATARFATRSDDLLKLLQQYEGAAAGCTSYMVCPTLGRPEKWMPHSCASHASIQLLPLASLGRSCASGRALGVRQAAAPGSRVCTRAVPSTKLPPARSILNHCRAAASGRSEGSAHDLLLCRCMPLTLGLNRKLGYTPLASCLLESRLESFACSSEHLKRTVWLSAASATPAVYLQQTTTVTDVLSWSETAAAPSVKMHAQSRSVHCRVARKQAPEV